MCSRKSFTLAAAMCFSLVLSSGLSAQSASTSPSWEDSRQYSVPGSALNKLEKDLQEASSQLTEAKTQLTTALTSFEDYKKQVLATEATVGAGAFVLGALSGIVATLIIHK